MEKGSELANQKTLRVFYELHEKIFSFLDFPSLMQSLIVSTEFYNLLNKFFKSFLVMNKLIDPTNAPTSGDHYLKIFRAFYSREVLVADLSTINNSYNELKFTRFPRCSTYGVKDFSMGTKFVVFHLFNNDIIFLKRTEYMDPSFDMRDINRKNIRSNVSKFYVMSKDLYYLTCSGHLHAIFYNEELPSDALTEGLLEFTIQHPLKDVVLSYYHAVLMMKVPESEEPKQLKQSEGQQEEYKPQKKKIYQDIRCLSLQSVAPEDFNAPIRLKKIDGLDDQPVTSVCVGISAAYFLAEGNKVYECDFSLINNEKYMIFPYEPLKNKLIKKLWSGFNSFFAFEQVEIDSIDNWTQNDILQWINNKNFSEFQNIIKYENITGKDLLNADKAFLIDRLGMLVEDVQVKFLNDIQKVSKKTLKAPRLYGWGNNSYGQLGHNTGNVTVSSPAEIPLPDLGKGDQIKHIECGWKASAILTQNGSIWITEVLPKKVPKEEEEVKGASGKKKKKDVPEEPIRKESEKVTSKWLDMTHLCDTLRDGRHYQIIKISLSKDKFAALGAYLGFKKKNKGQQSENNTSFSKFKGGDQIYNRILWDKSLNRDEFVVGYEDRFLGILEIPFNDFSLKTDIPLHRVKFFKRNGEIVWDRVSKMNNL